MSKRWQPSGSLAIVTGASSGVGRELTRLLADRQCDVIAVARRGERLQSLAGESAAGRVLPLVGDVTSPAVRRAAIEMVEQHGMGRLDLLVNNAGIGAIGPFEEAQPSRLRQIMEVNFFAPAEWTRDSLVYLKRGRLPVVCNVGSVLGHRAVPNKSEYCASKFALHGFTDALRAELAGHGIACTLVSPSTTESEFFDSLIDTDAEQETVSFGSWSAEKVARGTLAAITARRSEAILSLGGKALVYADRLAPPVLNAILARQSQPKEIP